MTEVRRNFGKRSEDEAAREHSRVGDLQVGRGDGFRIIEQNVQIQFARTFCEFFFAALLGFDGAQ